MAVVLNALIAGGVPEALSISGLDPALSGYLKGDGAGNVTATATIPAADLNGLNASEVETALGYTPVDTVTQLLTNPGLALKTASSALVKAANTFYAIVGGVLVKIAAGDMPALVGTVSNARFNVFAFFCDNAGTLTVAMGTVNTTLAAVVMPATPAGNVLVGFVIVNPTGAGNFVGGTTALDNVTVVPNAAYINGL